MSKKQVANPTTLGDLQPGDTCVLPRSAPITAHAVRVRVTGNIDGGVLWRHENREECCDGDGEPHVSPSDCSVTGVQRRGTTTESKAPNVYPLLGGAR